MKRFLATLFILSLLAGLLPTVGFAASGRLEITVPSGVSVTLKNAYAYTGSTVSADSTSTSGGYKTYVYEDLSTGSYSFRASGSGYNTLTKDIYYISGTTEKITRDPGKTKGTGYEPGSGIERTDELIANDGLFASTTTAWPGYEFVFDTPAFTSTTMGKQQFTSTNEMVAFLKSLLPICPNMYYYKVCTSPSYDLEMPLIVFTKTDLTGKTMEEAGALLQANGKPTVLHQAQVHGNEPAATEGALALANAIATGKLTDYEGNNILDSVNILLFPQINPDGSKKFQRLNVADGLNMNRGYLSVRSDEIRNLISVYNAFRPQVAMDAHEWTPDNTSEVSYFDDLWLFTCGSQNNSTTQLNVGIEMMETVFDAANEQNIRPYFYSQNMTYGTDSNSLAPYYYGLRGTYSFCIETRGIGIGRGCFERRVMSQYVASSTFIRYTAANAAEVMENCAQERQRIAEEGTNYSSDSQLVLKHTTTTYSKSYPRPNLNLNTNTVDNPNQTGRPSITNTISRSRTRPTAYILKSGTSGLSSVLDVMDAHGLPYVKLENAMTITVKQYSGSKTSASLGSATNVTFPAGSYIFPMNHSDGNITGMLMEPDVNDTYSSDSYSTFAQRSILSVSSIYRFEGNIESILKKPEAPTGLSVIQPTFTTATGTITGLDASRVYEYRSEGSSSYAPVAEGSTQIPDLAPGTYYVRFASVDGYQPSDDISLVVDPQPQLPRYTVTFYNADGSVLETQSIEEGSPVMYTGATPSKTYAEDVHYVFESWVDKDGNAAKLDSITADCSFYPTFSEGEHNYSAQTTLEPTCTEEGTALHTCDVCGRSYEEAISATGHSPVTDPGTAPTCTAAGLSDGSHCSVCQQVLVAQEVLDPKGHTAQIVPGSPASCLNSGLSDGQICADCGAVLVHQEVLPRLGHSYIYTDNGNGTHTGVCQRCSKTLSATTHSYDENNVCTLCGQGGVTQEPTLDEAVVIRHSLNLASDISVNYAIAASQLAGYDSFYLECVLPVYNGNEKTGSTSIRVEPELKGTYYYFTLTGVTAVQMGDIIEATLHMGKEGESYVSNIDSYSVATYAYAQLAKAEASSKLKSLCADLLYYGACAQSYKNYRTDAPVDAAMTEEQKSYLSNAEAVVFGSNNSILDDVEDPIITWAGKSLSLESKVILRFVIDTASFTGSVEELSLKVSYTDYEGVARTVILTDPTSYGSTGTRYVFDFDGLLAAELRSVVDVAVFAGETQVSSTLRYSADTYGNNKTGTLLTLCKALVAYSDSAKAYFVN